MEIRHVLFPSLIFYFVLHPDILLHTWVANGRCDFNHLCQPPDGGTRVDDNRWEEYWIGLYLMCLCLGMLAQLLGYLLLLDFILSVLAPKREGRILHGELS